uniref:Auxin response factor n=1 Tax=Oryza nivara TaxID=4536 RepID=A0A0E0IEP7_ORYNI
MEIVRYHHLRFFVAAGAGAAASPVDSLAGGGWTGRNLRWKYGISAAKRKTGCPKHTGQEYILLLWLSVV